MERFPLAVAMRYMVFQKSATCIRNLKLIKNAETLFRFLKILNRRVHGGFNKGTGEREIFLDFIQLFCGDSSLLTNHLCFPENWSIVHAVKII